ncbi:MAG: OmpA family protein [Owenweeksia sp.]|nr:OmpA family protein [Owenweeksia sp.]
MLRQNPKINIDIVGHTDSIPINTSRYSDNWDLSTARATTITRLLTEEYGIPGIRLTASGMSKFQPVANNDSKEGRAKNRRTEIILTPKLQELFKILEGGSSEPGSAEIEGEE